VITARRLLVSGIVQSVGFRPFVARLAARHRLGGCVLNTSHGVEIRVEGRSDALDAFADALCRNAPSAARIESIESADTAPTGVRAFQILDSERQITTTARVSPDLPVCDACLTELLNPDSRRFEYPYISCADCGPRYSMLHELPYDRVRTTMAGWPMCAACAAEYHDPEDRRCHVEGIACPACGPRYALIDGPDRIIPDASGVRLAAEQLRYGAVLAVKGVGGYHLSCDAMNPTAVEELRRRKFRKCRPFALMVRDLAVAERVIELSPARVALLQHSARPIVLAPAVTRLPAVAPDTGELGVMLPYAPIHHLLFAAGAPDVLVMTSANRSNEPIAFEDDDARRRLSGIADGFLVGSRPIARRLDDSIVRADADGPIVLRRGRGFAPAIVARLPARRPILAVGADLKNAVTLVVEGAALTSQHIGDLEQAGALDAFKTTIADLTRMHDLRLEDLVIAHDAHPDYASTAYAFELPAGRRVAVQHHRAHLASVLAERGALDTRIVGVAFDGTGYGDDGTIWGGEFFVGSVVEGFTRAASLRPFPLAGGDAAARYPVSAAAGILSQIGEHPDPMAPPFSFPTTYQHARQLVHSGIRTFVSTSAGRLFDAAAAILGFVGANDYEGQAAIWLEQLARTSSRTARLPYRLGERELDFGPTLAAMMEGRRDGQHPADMARGFHEAVAAATAGMARQLCERTAVDVVVISGGVFQNQLLVAQLRTALSSDFQVWINHQVPPNDGGISLGQAAIASMS